MKSTNHNQGPERESRVAREISDIRKARDRPQRSRLQDFESLERQREHESNMQEWAQYVKDRDCPRHPGTTDMER